MPRATLTEKKIGEMIEANNRRLRARRAMIRGAVFAADLQLLRVEGELIAIMRPFFGTILRAAKRGLK